MTGRTLLALAALGLASACNNDATPAATIGFRQPAAVAAFRGFTIEDTANVKPYFAVANAARNDLTILDAADDTSVAAPLALRALVVPVPDRPSLLVSAPLGDGRPDLLVAVSAGDSVLQVVSTWEPGNAVFSGAPGVDLGDEIVALTAVPSAPPTARVAAALSGGGIALVTWTRAAAGDAIELVGTSTAALAFQPVALAAMPDDPDVAGVQTEIYAATPDPIDGVFGVAAISADASLAARALDARAPTRLVAALRLRERDPASSAPDAAAFAGRAREQRVYAALDDSGASGCGLDARIDCGIVTLDPTKTTGGDAIPEDATGAMPYRAPIPIPGRPLALAVAGPPSTPPAADLPQYAGSAMRLMGGALEQATTGVGLVASDDGNVYFLDLGRHKLATSGSALTALGASAAAPTYGANTRLWLQALGGGAAFASSSVNAATDAGAFLDVTPGYTRDQTFTVGYQRPLPGLAARAAEAGLVSDDVIWLALQARQPTGLTQVVKVFHPSFGVAAGLGGDIAQIPGSAIPGCGATDLEARVDAILPPAAEHPGGALRLVPDPTLHADAATAAVQQACFDALETLLGTESPRLTATLRGRDLVLTGSTLGYAGRPQLGQTFALQYAGEDALAASCPLADWDGSFDPTLTCDPGCRAACEALVLARKARRFHHGYEACSLDAGDTDCAVVAGEPVPAAGPALAFRVGVQLADQAGASALARDQSLTITTTDGVTALLHRPSGSPYLATSAIAFDRSALDAGAGYRFLVSYGADLVLDVSPHVNPVQGNAIR